MSDILNEIVEGSVEKISHEAINDNTLYQFEDYPIGGITNEQMTNALTSGQSGFYQTNSVYMCIDGGTGKIYLKNHFYRFNVTSWEDVTPQFAGKIEEKTLQELENTTIEDSTLYAIDDYPLGGITQAQMTNALKITQRGFYKVNSVYLCVDGDGTSTYIKNHFYRFSYDETTDTYSWVDTKAGADVDSVLSLESENPVQNKVITENLNNKVSKTGDENIYGVKSFDVRPKLGIGEVRLPSEFTEVKYIQTDGNQYINTGANPSQARVLYDFEFTGGARQFIYGWYSGSSNMVYFPHKDSDGQLAIKYASTTQQFGVATNNYRYNVDATIYPGNIKIILNGSQIYSSTSSFTQTTRTLWLFCSNDSVDGAYLKSQVKLYSSKIYDGDTLIRDFVPCYTNQSVTNNGITYAANTIGLYDVVNDIFYVNSGTGVFLKGENIHRGVDFATVEDITTTKQELQTQINDKVSLTKNEVINGQKIFTERPQIGEIRLPNEFTEVEYIESTGTQYINLPFGFDNTDEIRTKFSINTTQTEDKYIVCPTTWNSNNNRFGLGVNNSGKYTAAYGSKTTDNTSLQPNKTNDGFPHNWSYKNKIFQVEVDNSISSLDVNNISFGETSKNLRLFYGYNSNTIGRIYSYIHKKANGTNINLIPCYTNKQVTNNNVTYEANTIGLYDIANNIFYINNGTGIFRKGQDIITGEYVALQSEIPIIQANPQGTAQQSLTKISINNIVYSIEGGGGSGGSQVSIIDWSKTEETAQ